VRRKLVPGVRFELEAISRRERAQRAGACCRNPERGRRGVQVEGSLPLG
jgi:hypothetical protein